MQITVQINQDCGNPGLRPVGTRAGDYKTLPHKKDGGLRLLASGPRLVSVRCLDIERAPKAFDGCTLITISLIGSCYRSCHKRFIPIDSRDWQIVSPVQNGVADQALVDGGGTPCAKPVLLGRHPLIHRPAHNFTRAAIHHPS